MADSVLARFCPPVAEWFRGVFAAPTPVQQEAWEAISAGEHALVVAPTGSGKTLAAFLWALNSLVSAPGQLSLIDAPPTAASSRKGTGVRVLYVSPLKALGVDVENNLRAPLLGIGRTGERLGQPVPEVRVGVRSGDTTSAERSRQVRQPPDILITTPESLYLMLTSKAGDILADVDTVIIDEIHAIAGTKRGAHLALSLERLERITTTPPQRIGLSATVRPLERVAEFLGGNREVRIINPPAEKKWVLDVRVPVEDMSDLPTPEIGSTIGEAVIDDPLELSGPSPLEESALPTQKSIWPFVEQDVYAQIMAAHSTLLFVNARRTAERLTSRLNELWAAEHDPESLSPQRRRDPAQMMSSADVAGKAPAVIARAHHGSVSKDERALTEQMLKSGELKCVVATSSLELGIDMGAVDLVIQVESPPSVASALQRVGRAGHTVGAVSTGVLHPKNRSDLLQTAVTVERMLEGKIEELKVPSNPLDVLVQQTIAATVTADIHVDTWYETVRRAYPYKTLDRDVFDAVIDLASGVYPSTDFAELKPRIVFDRITGMLSARPGAQRVAVTSGGTIPDRGMFGVFLIGSEDTKAPRRVGELDEEMVHESRVGDIFTLGATSWRVEDITRDQVLVSPAPGHTGRLPFWNGDGLGRPAELGKAVGRFRRELAADPARVAAFSDNARANLVNYVQQQQEATGVVPDEKTLVLERFKDELGDWRVVLHSPYGRGVNAAWALAIGARIAEQTGIDAQPVAGDDGIVLRLPEGESPPGTELVMFDSGDIEQIVAEQVGNSALFASRFRECAARALLLPRRNPGKRAPLWQQRQRAAQLLDIARKYPSFPVILETVRECLQDVYDLPALKDLCRDLQERRVQVAEVTVEQPSPFSSSLLFNYTGAFLYEGDSPLAEKRAAALALDPALLAKLLGTVELRELLDPDVIEQTHSELQRTLPGRQARTAEELADVLRVIGPIPYDDLPAHCAFDEPFAALHTLGNRVMQVRIAGREHAAISTDAPLLRDALGIPVPPGVSAPTHFVDDALEQLIHRFAKTRGPFIVSDVAEAFGLGVGTAHTIVREAARAGIVVEGRYRQGVDTQEYCAKDVLRTIRLRSLARAREQAEPVSQHTYARFLQQWHGIAEVGQRPELQGADGVFAVVEQLAGVRLPASAWESWIFPTRVAGYQPTMLDELTTSGEVSIVGAGKAGARDPWIMLLPSDYAAELAPIVDVTLTPTQQAVVDLLARGGGFYFPELLSDVGGGLVVPGTMQATELQDTLWELVEMGMVTPDGFGPIRARLAAGTSGKSAHRAKRRPVRGRLRRGRTSFGPVRNNPTPPDMLGRWSLAVAPATDATHRSIAHGEAWLERYGVVTRGSVVAEDTIGGFALAYKVLAGFEESGKATRGYLIDALGAAQFSTPAVVDRLRGIERASAPCGVVVLAAADPANPYGASLPWPEDGARLTRGAGALVVLNDAQPIAHLTRGGRTLTLLGEDCVGLVVHALGDAVARGMTSRITVEKVNGDPVLESALLAEFRAAGAHITPRGVSIGGAGSAGSRGGAGASGIGGRSLGEALAELGD